MSKVSMRIVLVDPRGDIMFSGESVIDKDPETDEPCERCPETLRSATSESGFFTAAARDGDAVETLPENGADEHTGEIRSPRSRAA